MSDSASTHSRRTTERRRIPGKAIVWGLIALVVVAMALDTTYRDADDKITSGGREAFDADKFGKENFAPKIVPALEKKAVDITELLPALRKDEDAASQQYGHREGNSPFTFPVRGEGIAGKPESGLMPVEIKGLSGTKVSVQIGPAINGTALRDATGLIQFNQFVNQVEYAEAATALNNQVKAQVLNPLDPKSLAGKKVSFLGAFTLLAPTNVVITPAALEVKP
jgi:predicted lipoprotein